MQNKHLYGPVLLAAVLTASHAGASSILELPAMEKPTAPLLAEPGSSDAEPAAAAEIVPGGAPVALSTSILMVGLPAVGFENTAAVGKEEKRRHEPAPLVIRGGISGDAFSRAAPAQASPRQASAPTAQRQESSPPAQPQGAVRRPE